MNLTEECTPGVWTKSMENAIAVGQKNSRFILVDWGQSSGCGFCDSAWANIYSQASFLSWSKSNNVPILYADKLDESNYYNGQLLTDFIHQTYYGGKSANFPQLLVLDPSTMVNKAPKVIMKYAIYGAKAYYTNGGYDSIKMLNGSTLTDCPNASYLDSTPTTFIETLDYLFCQINQSYSYATEIYSNNTLGAFEQYGTRSLECKNYWISNDLIPRISLVSHRSSQFHWFKFKGTNGISYEIKVSNYIDPEKCGKCLIFNDASKAKLSKTYQDAISNCSQCFSMSDSISFKSNGNYTYILFTRKDDVKENFKSTDGQTFEGYHELDLSYNFKIIKKNQSEECDIKLYTPHKPYQSDTVLNQTVEYYVWPKQHYTFPRDYLFDEEQSKSSYQKLLDDDTYFSFGFSGWQKEIQYYNTTTGQSHSNHGINDSFEKILQKAESNNRPIFLIYCGYRNNGSLVFTHCMTDWSRAWTSFNVGKEAKCYYIYYCDDGSDAVSNKVKDFILQYQDSYGKIQTGYPWYIFYGKYSDGKVYARYGSLYSQGLTGKITSVDGTTYIGGTAINDSSDAGIFRWLIDLIQECCNEYIAYSPSTQKYSVTFQDYDGTELYVDEVEEGKSSIYSITPKRDGYSFSKWDPEPTNVTSDLTCIAQYEKYEDPTPTPTPTPTPSDYDFSFNPTHSKQYVLKTSKFPWHYKFTTSGKKFVQMSNNVSAVTFHGSKDNSLHSQLYYAKMNANMRSLSSYSFYNCSGLLSVNMNDGLETIGEYCFYRCNGLYRVDLPNSLKKIEKYSFANCSKLNDISFYLFEHDASDSSQGSNPFHMESIGDNFSDSSKSNVVLIVPPSIKATNCLSESAFTNSAFKKVYFLGMASSSISQIQSTGMFGMTSNCDVYTNDGKLFSYIASAKQMTENTSYDRYYGIRESRAGNIRLRNVSLFTVENVNWCNDYTTRTTETKKDKFPSVNCPLIVIYVDLMTSKNSMYFVENIVQSDDFKKALKDNFNCYFFLLSRDADFSYAGSTPETKLFKKMTENCHRKEFISLNFFYNGSFNTVSVSSSISVSDLKAVMLEYAKKTGFDKFDYEPFEIKLEDPYVEEIPTIGENVGTEGFIPWWYNNGTIVDITETF